MLELNRIDGLLPCSLRHIDGQRYLYYEITGRQSLTNLFAGHKIPGPELWVLLKALYHIGGSLSEYLLDISQLVLMPDQIYFEFRTGKFLFTYLPGEQQDKRLRISFDFENPMSFEYYADEPNPAFEVVEKDESYFIEYNFVVSLNPLKNKVELEGAIDALNLKAEDLAGIPHVRLVRLNSGGMMGPGMDVAFFADYQLEKEGIEAVHKKLLDVLTAKGCKFQHAFSGKDMTPEELTAQGIHSYGIKLNDQQFTLMTFSDDRVGDFGGAIKFQFTKAKK